MRFSLVLTVASIMLSYTPLNAMGGGASAGGASSLFSADAAKATTAYNNKNLQCASYLKTFKNFAITNQAKYGLNSIVFYRIATSDGSPFIVYDPFSTSTAITRNGVHYYAVVDGTAFHNHDPTGVDPTTLLSNLFAPNGLNDPVAITTSDVDTAADGC